MKTKILITNFLTALLLCFNIIMTYFACGYIDMIWKISDTLSIILSVFFVLMIYLNAFMLFKNKF